MKEQLKIHITDLPIGLLCFPLMLLFLSVLSLWWAVLCLILSAAVLLIRTRYRGISKNSWISIIALLIKLVILLLGAKYLIVANCEELSYQILWILGFLLTHGLFSILIRTRSFPQLFTSSCCCDRHRNSMLLAEYRRFELILYRICLYSMSVCIPLIFFTTLSQEVELCIVGGIVLLSMGAIGLELLHLSWLRNRLSEESWIQVLDSQNNIIDRVPYTRISDYSEEGVFPLVRLLVVSQGMIYLEKTCLCNASGQECYDTPFVDWLNEGAMPEDVAQRMIQARFCKRKGIKLKQITPYRIAINSREYLVYLLVAQIENPSMLYIDCCPQEGKWWGMQLLKDSIALEDFSPHIANELPLIEQTVILAQQLAKQHKEK